MFSQTATSRSTVGDDPKGDPKGASGSETQSLKWISVITRTAVTVLKLEAAAATLAKHKVSLLVK